MFNFNDIVEEKLVYYASRIINSDINDALTIAQLNNAIDYWLPETDLSQEERIDKYGIFLAVWDDIDDHGIPLKKDTREKWDKDALSKLDDELNNIINFYKKDIISGSKRIIEDFTKTNSNLHAQKEICTKYSVDLTPNDPDFLLGISDNTNSKNMPINGLRHPVTATTSGWYIWSGKKFSKEKEFFKPLHIKHIKERCPQVEKFLALPPGYRFLIDDNGYIDVWYDPKLLEI